MARKKVALLGVGVILGLIGILIVNNSTKALVQSTFESAYAYTDKEIYPRGKTVTLTITNIGFENIIINYYVIIRVSPPAGNVTYIITAPENYLNQWDSLVLTWDQKDTFGNQALSGKYVFVIVYWVIGTDFTSRAFSSAFDIR